jgi:gas vesicle protein
MHDDREVMVVEESSSGMKWFLLGAAVGAGLGLLFAPQAGSRTRRDLVVRGRKLRAQAEDMLEDLSDEVETRGRQIRESVEELVEEAVAEPKGAKRPASRRAASARDQMERRLAEARTRARAAVGGDTEEAEDDESE